VVACLDALALGIELLLGELIILLRLQTLDLAHESLGRLGARVDVGAVLEEHLSYMAGRGGRWRSPEGVRARVACFQVRADEVDAGEGEGEGQGEGDIRPVRMLACVLAWVCSRVTCTHSVALALAAIMSGAPPEPAITLTSRPFSRRSLETVAEPPVAAATRASNPSLSVARRSAPAARSCVYAAWDGMRGYGVVWYGMV
jgi:hypothetical protein